jgi:multidrug efflux pump subunit AcrA (membrane-fusion protein)
MNRRRRVIAIALAAVVTAVVAAIAVERLSPPAGSLRVERGDLVIGVEVTGTLHAVDSSTLGPPQIRDVWQFKIAMMTAEGSEVTTGQPILAFDTSELQQRLQTKQADLDTARTEVEKKKVDLSVDEANDILARADVEARLRKARLMTSQPSELQPSIEVKKARLDLELAELEVDLVLRRIEATRRAGVEELGVLEANLEQVESEVREIEDGIGKMTRVAPRDGIVIHITNWRNEKRKVGDSCSVRDMVLEIPDLGRMEADGEVEEARAGRVREGQRVVLRLDAYPDHEYRGTVSSISMAVQEKSWRNPLKVVRLTLSLDETDPERMRPGMRFRGEIEIERLEDVTMIPIEAVARAGDSPVAYRYLLGGWRPIAIVLGRRNDDRVEVLEGLEPGDVVAAGGRP